MKKSGLVLFSILMVFLFTTSFPLIQGDMHVEYDIEVIDTNTGSGFIGGGMHGLDMGRHHVFYDETYGYWYAFCLWGDGVYTNQRLRYWSTREYNGTWTRQGFISGSVRGASGSGNGRNTAYTWDTYWEPGRRRVHIAYYLEDLGAYYRYGVPQSDGTLDLSGQRRTYAQSSPADSCGRVSVTVASDLHPWVWASIPLGYTNIVSRCRDTDGVYHPVTDKPSQWAAVGWNPGGNNYFYPHIVPVGEDGEVYAFATPSDQYDQVVWGSIFNGTVMFPATVTVTDNLCMKWWWTNNYYFSLFSVISWVHHPNARSSDMDYIHFLYKDFESGQRDGNMYVKNYTRSTNTWGAEVKIDDDDDYYASYGFSLSNHLTGINPPSSETGLWLSVEFAACVDGTGWYEFDYLEYYEGSWDATRNFIDNQSRGSAGIYYPLGTGSYSAHWYSIVNGSIPFVWTYPLGGEGMPLFALLLDTDFPLGVEIYVFEPEVIDPDLGLSPWVFTNWKYYEFNVAVPGAAVNNITMNFTIPTSFELVQCVFFCDGSNFTYTSNITDVTRYGEPIILRAGTFTQSSLWANATFHIFFEETVLDVWEEDDAISVEVSYDGGSYSYLADGNLFRIYSKGGFTLNTDSSNSSCAWILPGGTPFSFHVEDDGLGGGSEISMYNEIWFRDVQHLKLLPEIHFLTGLDGFDIRYGVDYSFGDGWQTGWYFDINPVVVHYNGLFTAAVWMNFTVYFCDRNGIVSEESLYMFNHGSIVGSPDPGYWEMYVDLWVSDVNASSVGAGRVNAYEYPMEELGALWMRWLTSNWAPMDSVYKEWSGMVPLLASDDSTIMSSESVVMWRYWSRVQVYSSAGGQVIEVRNFEQFDDTRSQVLPLTGISTPVFDETITPAVGQKGLLGALFTMFASIGSFLGENIIFGGLNLWGTFVNFLDSIAAMFGAPRFFTNLFIWIGQLIGYIGTSIVYIGTVLTSLFLLFGSLMGVFLTEVGNMILSLINTLGLFGDMMGGAYGVGVNVWEDLGIMTWITVALPFYGLYLVILWDEQGDAAVIEHLTMVFGLLNWVFGFFVELFRFVADMITDVIESIPVAE